MMKLRFLYDNRDLAVMLLQNWDYDASSLELMDRFRVSANAVYPFKNKGELQFLRFAPISEKTEKSIQGEIDFIKYLLKSGYNANAPVESKDGQDIVIRETPWGEYCAVVYKSVVGKPMAQVVFDHEKASLFGRTLGLLHDLSSRYHATKDKRWTHHHVLDWIEETLTSLDNEIKAKRELSLLREYFLSLPVSKDNYGLIHYDYELDNVFFDEEKGSCSVIDFDDSMYHWYAMDIEQSLDSIQSELPESDFNVNRQHFLAGYRSAYTLSDEELGRLSAYRRFANLYGYTRIKRSIQESWPNETGWIVGLRKKLVIAVERKSKGFGVSVH